MLRGAWWAEPSRPDGGRATRTTRRASSRASRITTWAPSRAGPIRRGRASGSITTRRAIASARAMAWVGRSMRMTSLAGRRPSRRRTITSCPTRMTPGGTFAGSRWVRGLKPSTTTTPWTTSCGWSPALSACRTTTMERANAWFGACRTASRRLSVRRLGTTVRDRAPPTGRNAHRQLPLHARSGGTRRRDRGGRIARNGCHPS
jgi:hypothetical protein